jgi:sugar/nucleoside kinase (ribokinase family)
MIKKGIAVIGSTAIDKIIKKDHTRYLKLGGVTTYSGITYSRHDIKTHIVTNVAAKDLPFIRRRLNKENINVHAGSTEHTTHFVNTINDDGRRQRIPLKAKPIVRDQIIKVFDLVDCLHLGPLHPMDIESDAFPAIKNSKLSIFLDAQGYVRLMKDEVVYSGVTGFLTDALMASQIVKTDELELEIILHHYKMNLSELMAKHKIEEFVVSRGPDGGFVKTIAGDQFEYRAAPIRLFDDSTGAGDVFFAAYIVGRFFKKKDVIEASSYAANLSARQVEGAHIKPDELCLN